MDQPNNQDCCCLNEQGGCCCCPPMTEESDILKKLKPILTVGIVVYCALFVLDLSLLYDGNFFFYLFFIFAVCFLIYNRCFIIFQFYTLGCIFLIFGTALPRAGIIIQNNDLKNSLDIIRFSIYIFIIIFSIIFYYFSFEAYKEIRYLYLNRSASNPQLNPYMITGPSLSNNNYNNNNYNNSNNDYRRNNNDNNNSNNNSQTKGFKAFSGKGYKVGGS